MEATGLAADHKRSDRKRKGPGRDSTSAKAIEVNAQHAKWAQDRLQGLSYRYIGARDGVSPGTVHSGVVHHMERTVGEPIAELRAKELRALEELLEMTLQAIEAGAIERIEQLRKILADRRKLLGLDAPTKVEVKPESETVDVEQLRALLRPLGWDIVPIAIETTGEEAKSE